MDFVDTALVRLADPATRNTLFDQAALAQIVAAAYGPTDLEGPYTPVFDDFRLGLTAARPVVAEGVLSPVGGGVPRIEARFVLSGVESGPPAHLDALWRGAIVARTRPVAGRIESARFTVPATGDIDAEIAADLGALPADPDAREAERRARLLARLRAAAAQPDALNESDIDALLAAAGADSVGHFLEQVGGAPLPGILNVRFAPAPAGDEPALPRPLPLAAVILVRGRDNFSLASLFADTARARERVAQMGIDVPHDPERPPRRGTLVVWVLEREIFDDEDWPGAAGGGAEVRREARRAAAGAWLAREGIGLAVPPL